MADLLNDLQRVELEGQLSGLKYCRGSGSNLESFGSCDPLPKLFREDCLKKRSAQADPEDLTRRSEKIRDAGSNGDVLSCHICDHGL